MSFTELRYLRESSIHSGEEEHNSWEFDTVRARSSTDTHAGNDSLLSMNDVTEDGMKRSHANARVPPSFRLLFGEDSRGPNNDQFAGFPNPGQPRSRSNTPTMGLGAGLGVAGSPSPTPDRDRQPARRRGTTPGGADSADETVRRLDFVFPPRPGQGTRLKSKLSSSVPASEDETERQPPSPERERARLLPLGPGHGQGHSHGHGRGIGDATMSTHSVTPHGRTHGSTSASNDIVPVGQTVRPNPSYKDVRTSRGLPNISIPPVNMHGSLDMAFESPSGNSANEELNHSSSSPSKSNFTRPIFNRKRSQSSAAASSSTSPRKLNFPVDFHFPPVASTANLAGPSFPPPISAFNQRKTHNAMSPSHGSLSSSSSESRSPAAHQTTHSLDNTAIYNNQRLFKSAASSLGPGTVQEANAQPPSLIRPTEQLSGQPVSRRPSVTRQASVAVMETVHSTAIELPSAKLEPDSPAPIPGLKDVLKVPSLTSEMHLGIADLLPPSPSAASSNRRFFTPIPSSLGSNVISSDTSNNAMSSSLQTRLPPSSPLAPPSIPVQASAPNSPRPEPVDASATTSGYALNGHKVTSSVSSISSLGPPMRPLDLGALISSHESTHAELARTVDELLQWLNIVENGLSQVLHKKSDFVIQSTGEIDAVQEDELESLGGVEYDMVGKLDGHKFADTDEVPLKPDTINIDDDDDDDYGPEEGTFEQFLAKMQQRNRTRAEVESGSSSEGENGLNISPDHTVRPLEQLAANVTI